MTASSAGCPASETGCGDQSDADPESDVIRALLIDMEGVLFHGEHPLPGAARTLRRVAPIPHLFVTNNPILTPDEVVQKFARLGLPVPRSEQILTSAEATAAFLERRKPGFHYFAVGAGGLHRALAAVGRMDAERADFVVVGEGAGLDYQSLAIGINLIVKRTALVRTGRSGPGETLPHACGPPDWDSRDLPGLMERLEAELPPAGD